MGPSDGALFEQWAATRDADAFAEIVARHSAMVYGTCRRVLGNASDAEDVAQECFIELARPGTTIKRSLGGWLHRAAVHRSLNRIKAEKRRKRREARFAARTADRGEMEWDDVQAVIDEAIATLPDKLREPVVYRFLEGQSYEAIARNLAVSPSTVQYRVNKGLEGIRTFLKRRGVPVATASLTAMLSANLSAEAAPATLTAALGKLAIASKVGAGTIGTAATGAAGVSATGIAALGGALIMKKAIVGIVVVAAGVAGLWAVTQKQQPEPVEVASEIAVAINGRETPEPGTVAASAPEPVPEEPVRGEAAGFEDAPVEPAQVAAAAPEGGAITGRVYDARTGEGIEGVRVRCYQEPDRERRGTSEPTDAYGRYSIVDLPDGGYIVGAYSGDGPLDRYPAQLNLERTTVTVSGGKTVDGVDFGYDPGVRIAGKVVDEEGNPVEGARVGARASMFSNAEHAESKHDGSFEVYQPMPSDRLLVQARKDPFESEISGPLTLTEAGLQDVVLELTVLRNASISGMVVGPAGRPVENARVYLDRGEADYLFGSGGARSAVDGTFAITDLAPGEYGIQLTEPTRKTWSTLDEVARVEIKAGQALSGLRLVLGDKTGLAIVGRVVDTAGNPIVGARVSCHGPERQNANSGERGTFMFAGLAEGEYGISADHPDFSFLRHRVIALAGSEGVEVVLQGKANIEGRVVRADTGEPLTDFEVFNVSADYHFTHVNSRLFRNRKQMVDPEGRFKLAGMPVGNVTVTARAAGFAPAFVNLTLAEHDTVTDVELRLEPGQPLTGRVVDDSGNGIAGALIYLNEIPEMLLERAVVTRSGSEGRFTIEDFPPDVGTVAADHPNYGPAAAPVTADTVIVLQRPARLEGVVTLAGTPLAEATVSVQQSPESRIRLGGWCRTESDGSFAIPGLAAGLVKATARWAKTRDLVQTVVLEPAQTTRVEFNFEQASAVLEGRVTVRGQTPTYGTVELHCFTAEGVERHNVTLQADGGYVLRDLSVCTATMKVQAWLGEEYRGAYFDDIIIGEDEALTRDIDLSGNGQITGRFLGFDPGFKGLVHVLHGAMPHSDALDSMAFGSWGHARVAVATVEPDASFHIQGLEPGTYTLLAETRLANDYLSSSPSASSVVSVESNETVTADFDLR